MTAPALKAGVRKQKNIAEPRHRGVNRLVLQTEAGVRKRKNIAEPRHRGVNQLVLQTEAGVKKGGTHDESQTFC